MRSPNARSFFHPVGRFMRGAAETIEFARKAHAITQTPDDVFAARGTTRQAALRELIDQ